MSTSDPTFRNYKADQAAKYAAHRGAYPDQLIRMVIDAHTSSGGKTDAVVDVGCGPGIATRQIAPHFQHAIGLDPGQSMIEAAQSDPPTTKSGETVRFEVCSAEELGKFTKPESADLITAATAAHWFDLPKFYAAAAQALRPGGSIILWASGEYFVDADTPNADEVRRTWRELESTIQPYELPGNKHCRQLYVDLDLPWTITGADAEVQEALSQYDETISRREVFNEDGQKDSRFEGGYLRHRKAPFHQIRAMLGTVSPVTRWREAHKAQLEKGEIEDYVDKSIRLTRETMAKVPGGEGVQEVGFATSTVMIVIKKKGTVH